MDRVTGDDISLVRQGAIPVSVMLMNNIVGAIDDPQFHGLLGQSYQIHGIDGGIYSIISQSDMSMTSRFTYLSSGKCPICGDKSVQPANCWSHPGSYFGSIGIQTLDGNKVLIEAGEWNERFSKVEINNESVDVSSISDSNYSSSVINIGDNGEGNDNTINLVITLNNCLIDRYHLSIQYGIWIFHIDNSDMFVNLNRVEVLSWSTLVQSVKPHGLLGQTWKLLKGKECGNQVKEIAGEVDDYVIDGSDGGMFGYDFVYNKFQPTQRATEIIYFIFLSFLFIGHRNLISFYVSLYDGQIDDLCFVLMFVCFIFICCCWIIGTFLL